MKILTVVGARPQFIKAATVSRALAQHPDTKEIIVHTGQHFDANMSQVFFDEMQIPKPSYNLEAGGLGHAAMTGKMMEGLERIMLHERPDWVLVYGDTNSTLAGSLTASKLHIPVAHVEAGLRSFDMRMPEEINRILTDRVSSMLFCPTESAIQNLANEGFGNFNIRIVRTGDVMLDAALHYRNQIIQSGYAPKGLEDAQDFILVTMHRQENTDDEQRLREIVDALNELANKHRIIFPIHPRTSKILDAKGIKLNFETVEPLGYLDMVWLLDRCKLVLTDSGGLQKEAFFFKKYCVTLRFNTEWTELLEAGVSRLAGSNKQDILHSSDYFLSKEFDYTGNLYGDGKSAASIASYLTNRELSANRA